MQEITTLSQNLDFSSVAILLEYIGEELLGGANDLDANTPLLAHGVIDSLSTVSVITFIRERFGVEVPNDAVIVNNFETVTAIAAMVDQLVEKQSEDRMSVARRVESSPDSSTSA